MLWIAIFVNKRKSEVRYINSPLVITDTEMCFSCHLEIKP